MTVTDETVDPMTEAEVDRDDDEDSSDVADLEGLRDHVARRTIVLPEHRILFMPTPKAACTTILWQLARLGGQPLERFEESGLSEVSTALTIHDMARWESRFRFFKLTSEEREEILGSPDWLRFTIVRDPAPRVWSAWQSKLLLREPRFVADFGEAPWFPRLPATPDQVIEDFRAFVVALADPTLEDAHWTLQRDLLAGLPFNHVGRTESLADTISVLKRHIAQVDPGAVLQPGRDNRTPLRMPASAYDEAAAAVLNERYAADFETYGYAPVVAATQPDLAWAERTAAILPLLSELIDRNARVGQLSSLAKERGVERRRIAHRLYKVEQRLEGRNARRVGAGGAPGSPVMTNVEGRSDFTVRWAWDEGPLEPGFTAIVRVKNEARPLPFVLPPLLRALRRVVLVDNESTDGTPDLAAEIAERAGKADRLRVVSYPFDVARCGPEHLGTPAASVHSLTYFYNWSFSQVRSSYALKWDGDMVLTETGVKALQDIDWQLEATLRVVTMPRYPLYVADDSTAFFDVGLANNESWGWPNRPGYAHVKAIDWELPLWPENTYQVSLPDWSCVELKWLEEDEFAHWSTTDFSATNRTQRKRREFDVFQALTSGAEPPRGVIPVHAPAGVHVVDWVREQWLRHERPRLGELARDLAEERSIAKQEAAERARAEGRARRDQVAARRRAAGLTPAG
jgi:hypothetical protein